MGKFNEEQLRTLLDFMTTYPVMLQKRCRANNKPRMDLWKDLSDRLNSQGPPYKSEIAWRRSWAKKKFEMGRVKKRRVSVYADLDNLLAKSSEFNEEGYSNDEEYEVEVLKSEDPLQIRKKPPSQAETRHKKLKVEVLEKEDEAFDSSPNGVLMEESSPAAAVGASGHKKLRPKSNHTLAESSFSSSSAEVPAETSERRKSRSSRPENSVELFFKSLAMEVNKANLPSEKLFNLEWSVLKLVSEKIKEFADQTVEVQPRSN